MRPRFSFPALLLGAGLALTACGGSTPPPSGPPQATKNGAPADPGTTKVNAFAISPESLNVDLISMRDGIFSPDGNRDLVFTASVEGPADAIFLVTTSAKGEPVYGFRADTVSGREELPSELGSVVDLGALTLWVAISENGKWINGDGGRITLARGAHNLRLIVPNSGTLRPGSHLRLYARQPGGVLVAGPVIAY